jgi:hypothetical protein
MFVGAGTWDFWVLFWDNASVPIRWKSWIAVFFLPLLLGAPFVGRAFFVDDNYQMLMARGTMEHPLRPYDFKADDNGLANSGWDPGQPPRMVNPPLPSLYARSVFKMRWRSIGGCAGVGFVVGGGERGVYFSFGRPIGRPPRGRHRFGGPHPRFLVVVLFVVDRFNPFVFFPGRVVDVDRRVASSVHGLVGGERSFDGAHPADKIHRRVVVSGGRPLRVD